MSTANPFVDPVSDTEDHERALNAEATLNVGKDASLTLGTDSLIVLDEAFEKVVCCGVLRPSASASTRAIPFYNILWAELSGAEITIDYANAVSKVTVRPASLSYTIDKADQQHAVSWIERLLERSYGASQLQKRAKVLVNPHSGKGKGSSEKMYWKDIEPILRAAHCSIDMVKTKYSGEAVEISEKLDVDAFDIVATCSGDGLVYEVFNGLGKRPDAKRALSKIAVVHVPCGSGNAMSCNLNGTDSPSLATLAIIKGIPTPLDLMSVSQGNTRTLSFLSQSVGIIAESDLATDNLRWMGSVRFTYGFLVRLLGQALYPCDLAVKIAINDKQDIKEHYRQELSNHAPASERRGSKHLLDDNESTSSGSDDGLPPLRYGTVHDKLPDDWEVMSLDKLGNFYAGNMAFMASEANFFSAALPNDGCLDLICVNGDIPRLSAMNMLTLLSDGKLIDSPLVTYRKVLGYRITPKQKEGYISVDGERIPFEAFQVEVHRGLGTVLSKTGHMYETQGAF